MEIDDISFDFSHPELLSKEELKGQLIQRGFAPSSCTHKDKDDLLELYYKYACPMPQRKYRINRRGRVMAKSQIMIAKRKRTYEQMKETDESHGRSYTYAVSTGNQDQLTKNMPKSGLINQFDLPTSGKERLKPPPVVIDPNKKVVKLGGSKVTTNEVCSVGERKKISFNSDRNTSQRSPNKKSSDLNSIVINSEIKRKTPVTTGLDHVVINSNIKKGNRNGSECDKHRPSSHGLDSTNMDTGESDRTDSQQEGSTGQKSRTKIRLKRPSDIKIPSTEEILSHSDMCGVTDDTSNGCDSLCKEGDRDVTPEKPTPVLLSPKQRQLRLINQTLKQGETLNKDKVGSQTEGQKNEDEEMVTKKFKRVAISWP